MEALSTGITFSPSNQTLTTLTPAFLKPASSATAMLEGACLPMVHTRNKEMFQSSFKDLTGRTVVPSANGFVHAVMEAYGRHHKLVVRPDDVWLTILTQFSLFVNANAESLRAVFVKHEGKKELEIRSGGTRYTADFGSLAQQMTVLIEQNVIDQDLRKWIMPDFSTSTPNDKVVASVLMMATMKEYFAYKETFSCGLPEVTLLGTKQDWEKLLKKIDKLRSYGAETTQWHGLLKPVLTQFVNAFDGPNSDENKSFWNKIVNVKAFASFPTTLTGWITAFTFFNFKGTSLFADSRKSRGGLLYKGVQFHKVEVDDIPAAYAEVDVKLDDNGQVFKALMVAGVVGIRTTENGVTGGGSSLARMNTLQPEAGWWIFDKKPATPSKAVAA